VPWHPTGPDELIAELTARAPEVGANTGAWPGLTIYRFISPVPLSGNTRYLSLCIVAQGREAMSIDGETYVYGPFQYLMLGSHVHIEAEILEASARRAFLAVALQIDPGLVCQVSSAMLEPRTTAWPSGQAAAFPVQRARASVLDQDLLGAVLRFLRAIGTGMDRRILAPLYLREMIYRILQREQYARLRALAAAEAAGNPVAAVLEHVRAHLSDPLTVSDMADLVSLSPSAFAHLFRDVTGRSPYQFLKEMRLDRARELLADGNLTVTRISKEVGYASVSHFISEFRGRFGMTPRTYSDVRALPGELNGAGMGNSSAGI
jgi:AraC-like DNA-binding protein